MHWVGEWTTDEGEVACWINLRRSMIFLQLDMFLLCIIIRYIYIYTYLFVFKEKSKLLYNGVW